MVQKLWSLVTQGSTALEDFWIESPSSEHDGRIFRINPTSRNPKTPKGTRGESSFLGGNTLQ